MLVFVRLSAVAAASNLFHKGSTMKLHEREILSRVPVFPVLSPAEVPIRYIDKQTQLALLELIPEQHRAIFHFLMYHPVRIGEGCALQRKHFDLDAGVVQISQAVGYRGEIKERKTKRAYCLPLSVHFDTSALTDMLPDAYAFTSRGHLALIIKAHT